MLYLFTQVLSDELHDLMQTMRLTERKLRLVEKECKHAESAAQSHENRMMQASATLEEDDINLIMSDTERQELVKKVSFRYM